MAEAATSSVETFSSLPYDVHVIIVKLLNLKEALVYGEITHITGRAVLFVFSHRRQLDFGSVLGSNGQIMLPDDVILHVLNIVIT